MKSIKANTFFRINFILQDNSASTTRNYLANIIIKLTVKNILGFMECISIETYNINDDTQLNEALRYIKEK